MLQWGSNSRVRNLEGFKGEQGGLRLLLDPPSRVSHAGMVWGLSKGTEIPEDPGVSLSSCPQGSSGGTAGLQPRLFGRLLQVQGPGDAYRVPAGQEGGAQGNEAQPRLQGQRGRSGWHRDKCCKHRLYYWVYGNSQMNGSEVVL